MMVCLLNLPESKNDYSSRRRYSSWSYIPPSVHAEKDLGTWLSSTDGYLRPYEPTTGRYLYRYQYLVIHPANCITTHVGISGTRTGFCQICEMLYLDQDHNVVFQWLPRLKSLAMNDGHEQAWKSGRWCVPMLILPLPCRVRGLSSSAHMIQFASSACLADRPTADTERNDKSPTTVECWIISSV